ncbi:hypothetical protein GCM10010383_75020 [Streptomyces lomondensis]|uniref:Uncharacterized protein n=1 Tax=Streptomyces lomondensis TaxID=68229 RepID=A0ABQ2XTK0_9ACTN|nr:hypothetical protein GCM10010383_75020 [Streptomyces lomondensis]
MTTPEAEPGPPDTEDEFQRLGEHLLRTAKSSHARAAIQALIEEQTILSVPAVRHTLISDTDDGEMAHFEGLAGHQYSLGLDKGQRYFLELVLSMVGSGWSPSPPCRPWTTADFRSSCGRSCGSPATRRSPSARACRALCSHYRLALTSVAGLLRLGSPAENEGVGRP